MSLPRRASRAAPGRHGPRRLGEAIGEVRAQSAPATLLAAVQSVWPAVTGAAVAAEAEPVGEREGVITVACRSATWAQELDLMGPELLERLNGALGEDTSGLSSRGATRASEAGHGDGRAWQVEGLRFTADAARHA